MGYAGMGKGLLQKRQIQVSATEKRDDFVLELIPMMIKVTQI
jgi:hypothetical protein